MIELLKVFSKENMIRSVQSEALLKKWRWKGKQGTVYCNNIGERWEGAGGLGRVAPERGSKGYTEG